jgi:hypothetical protein
MARIYNHGRSPWRKIYALPAEHGSWVWWIGPFVLGAAAAETASPDLIPLGAALLLAFLIRQPVSLLVKVMSGRRARADLPAVRTWLLIYGLLLTIAGVMLILCGHPRVYLLLLPGLPVFGWHLWLVSRREERGQRGIEIVGSGVLALAAPAAYWVCGGSDSLLPWTLWLLAWLQSAASIVQVYLRLEQRTWEGNRALAGRINAGARSLAYHGVNVLLSIALSWLGHIPWLVSLAFGLMAIDALLGILRPAAGQLPTRIGLHQLFASIAFYTLAALSFSL